MDWGLLDPPNKLLHQWLLTAPNWNKTWRNRDGSLASDELNPKGAHWTFNTREAALAFAAQKQIRIYAGDGEEENARPGETRDVPVVPTVRQEAHRVGRASRPRVRREAGRRHRAELHHAPSGVDEDQRVRQSVRGRPSRGPTRLGEAELGSGNRLLAGTRRPSASGVKMRRTKLWFEAYAKAERVMDGVSKLAVKAGSNATWVEQLGSTHDEIESALTQGFLEQLKKERDDGLRSVRTRRTGRVRR